MRTVTFTTDELAQIIDLIQTYAGDSYDSQSYLMDQWFMDMLEARLNGHDDPEKPSEVDLASEKNRPIIREGTVWRWQGGFDGSYVDSGEEPSRDMKMWTGLAAMTRWFDTPFLDMFPKTVTVGDPPMAKMEWGWIKPDED